MIHLLPYDGIGGAESAARTMLDEPNDAIDFRVHYVFPNVQSRQQRWRTFNPMSFVARASSIMRAKPDLLIVSLWRSCIVGILVRLLRPRTKLVVLIHNSVDAHWLDHVFTRWAMSLSEAVWADSNASVQLRFPDKSYREITVISFLARRLAVLEAPDLAQPKPAFIFWGRLAPQKNLPRALRLFQLVLRARPDARFTVIGPDAGELTPLRALCEALSLTDAVRFAGAMNFSDIREEAKGHSFYLQTSAYEGMAMSVVEAMQLGLVPVVTPVGEIRNYCRDGKNAVIVGTDEQAAAAVLGMVDDPLIYAGMRRNAILSWQHQPLYRDSVFAECIRILSGQLD